MACSRHFHDAMEALNSYGDLMVQEGLEFIIGSSEGNSKLTIDLCQKISAPNPLTSEKSQTLSNVIKNYFDTIVATVLRQLEKKFSKKYSFKKSKK